MWYRRENGSLSGGPYNCPQQFPVEFVDDQAPEALAFNAPRVPLDRSNIDMIQRELKALALCVAQVGGLTVPQMKALYRAKWESMLP